MQQASLLALVLAAGVYGAADNTKLSPLRFREDGTFHISVFSDLHLGMYASTPRGPKQDAKSVSVLASVLDIEKPDFAVINGDLINGDDTRVDNSTRYIDQIVKPLVDRNLTWGSTYGNHDHQPNLSGELLLTREQTFPGARTRSMVPGVAAGSTNYYLPVYSAACKNVTCCTPKLLLWFFDSRGGYYYQQRDRLGRAVHHPNWIDESVVRWFEETNAALRTKHGRAIPSLGFVHIPVYASVALQNRGVHPNRQPGINDETASPQAQGWCAGGVRDGCAYGGQDAAFMKALAGTEGLMALFSGHDHANSWCYKWDGELPGIEAKGRGVNLCYGQHTGYGGYGDWIRGSRELIVSLDKLKDLVIDSHIRTERGEVIGKVSLNATYGQDMYPASPNDKTYL
ncbi:Metallophosphoesterase [Cordyceps fumosorosea ARSEF 2679]|uniref:Metallophosphoesterase n=1 Tax=Cordyceps fumosorosea (strain ARSEF 2679) TaxID=1081104 RepID=A0A168CJX0_CORFA|nr:Metallophosphoesterase [Cordyceps fumosorosea ARSEF 2679]OAA71468.1 Metallophosphoesterase [Cordyceps fumosorosea ARSEF 2679]